MSSAEQHASARDVADCERLIGSGGAGDVGLLASLALGVELGGAVRAGARVSAGTGVGLGVERGLTAPNQAQDWQTCRKVTKVNFHAAKSCHRSVEPAKS